MEFHKGRQTKYFYLLIMNQLKQVIEQNWDKRNFSDAIVSSGHFEELKQKTSFLDENYPDVPVRTRGYVVLNEINEVPICPCGCNKPVSIDKHKPINGFRKYNRSTCANNVKIPSDIIEKLDSKEWLYQQRVKLRKSFVAIAQELNVSRTTVEAYLNKHQIGTDVDSRVHSPESRATLEDKEKLGSLYNSGMTTIEIGKLLKVDKKCVNQWLRKHGIQIRKRGNGGIV